MSQGWELDGTDFFDYGVWVTKSSGVLNMPKAVDVSIDWLDEEGRDYWQPIGDVLSQNRLIVLNCFIESDSFANFKTAVDAFYTALLSPNQRALKVPYLAGTIECYLDSKVEMKNSNYIRTQQIGVFTLNLTVREDSIYKQITVYKEDDTVRGVFNYDAKFKIFKKLQGANYASFSVENNTILDIQRNDYILLSHVTGITDKYYLERDPEIKKISTNKYVHQLRFEYESNLLSRVDFLILDNAETSYWGSAEDVIDRLIENTEIDYTGVFTKGTIVSTSERNHQFQNQNCYQVLQQMAKEYEIEFDLKTVGGSVEISLVAQIGTSATPGLAYGKGNGLFTLTRDSINNEDLTTVLHAFGSTKNLPDTYAYTRLRATTFPIESNKATYGAYSKTKNFDEIFPEYTGTVSTYFRDLNDDGVDLTTYYITDAAIPFDINSQLLPGITAKIVFKTGDLSGYEFPIKRYDHASKTIYFIEFKNPRGAILPSSTLFPIATDTYTIVDIDLPASYVTDAETRLLAAANTYIATKDNPKVTYRGHVTAAYQYDVVLNGYDIGDNVPITDTDFGLSAAEQRISDLTYNVFFGSYDLILSEAPLVTFRESVKQRLDEVEKTQDATDDQDTITIRKRRVTGFDIETAILDPSDSLLNLDRRGRNRSVDARHLNEESGTLDYSVKDLPIWPNYLGDTEKINVGAGSVTVNNWRPSTLNRFDIREITNDYANPENYNPVKTFTIAEDTIDLPTTDPYYIYAKVPASGSPTTGTIEVDSSVHKRLHYDEDYFLYKLAEVTEGGQDRFAYPIFGNTKSAQIDSPNFTGAPTAPSLTINGQLTSALTGTVSVTIATNAVVGIGTSFTTELNIGDAIKIADEIFTVSGITDNLNLTLDSNHTAGASGVTAYTDADFISVNNGDSVNQMLLDNSGGLSVLGTVAHAAPVLSTESALLSDVEALDLDGVLTNGNTSSLRATFGDIVTANGPSARLVMDATVGTFPGFELKEVNVRKWLIFNQTTVDELKFNDNSGTVLTLEQGGALNVTGTVTHAAPTLSIESALLDDIEGGSRDADFNSISLGGIDLSTIYAELQINSGWETGIIANEVGFNSSSTETPVAGTHFGFFATLQGNANYGGALAMRNDKIFFQTREATILQGWRELYHSGNSNLSSIDWAAKIGTFSGTVTAPNFVSNVAIGTQPYATTSTTLNTNLNADLLDSQHGSYYLDYNNFTNTPTIINNHSGLSELDYASAGHTGFEQALTFSTGLTRITNTITTNDSEIDHDGLLNYVIGQHRIINDAGTSATELWSASKINTEIGAITNSYISNVTEASNNITFTGVGSAFNGSIGSIAKTDVANSFSVSAGGYMMDLFNSNGAGSGLRVRGNNIALSVNDASAVERFQVAGAGNIYMKNLTAGTKTNVVYIDPSTKELFEGAAPSGTVTFGTTEQIPYVNPGGTDFIYAAGLTFDGSILSAPSIELTSLRNSSSTILMEFETARIDFDAVIQLHQLSSDPGSVAIGDMWFNTTLNAPIVTLSGSNKLDITNASGFEKSSDPATITSGYVMWQSDGTGSGDDGDIMIKINDGSTTKTITLVDFSAF